MSKEDLLNLWLNHRAGAQDETPQPQTPHKSVELNPTSRPTPLPEPKEVPPQNRPEPVMSGRLAEYLAQQPPRNVRPNSANTASSSDPRTTDDEQTRAAVAMSLILASNLIRFASTRLSEQHLVKARDEALHAMKAKDAISAEVEAYELMSWFAGAMDESWAEKKPRNAEKAGCETSEASLIQIIESAIQNRRDLFMHYYTGSRGDFSERTVTPIEIAAEKYLIAFCHTRGEERVFRLSRILELSQISDNADENRLPSYPCASDTQLPPLPGLPEPPAPAEPDHKNKSSKKRKSGQPKSTKPAKTRKSSGTKKTQDAQPSLFDPPKKKKTSKKDPQSRLPGF